MDLRTLLRDWIHETPLSLCDTGTDSCPDWELAYDLADAVENPDSDAARARLMERTSKVVAVRADLEIGADG